LLLSAWAWEGGQVAWRDDLVGAIHLLVKTVSTYADDRLVVF